MIRVKTAAERDKLAGRAPKAAPAPAPKPAPVAAAPAPQQAAPKPAPSGIDPELRAWLGAMAQNLTVATNLIAQQAKAATQQAAPAPPQLPQPALPGSIAPPEPVLPVAPTVPRFVPSIPRPMPSEAQPGAPMPPAAPEPAPTGPLEAVVVRDKFNRLLAVTITGAVPMSATITRDKDRMSTIAIERDGKKMNGIIHRDRKGRIEKLTIESKESAHAGI